MYLLKDLNVGNNIKKYRKEKGLTQLELGQSINKSESTIRKYESGAVNITMDTLSKIAAILGVPIEKFMEMDNPTGADFILWHSNSDSLVKDLLEIEKSETLRQEFANFCKAFDIEIHLNKFVDNIVTTSSVNITSDKINQTIDVSDYDKLIESIKIFILKELAYNKVFSKKTKKDW